MFARERTYYRELNAADLFFIQDAHDIDTDNKAGKELAIMLHQLPPPDRKRVLDFYGVKLPADDSIPALLKTGTDLSGAMPVEDFKQFALIARVCLLKAFAQPKKKVTILARVRGVWTKRTFRLYACGAGLAGLMFWLGMLAHSFAV